MGCGGSKPADANEPSARTAQHVNLATASGRKGNKKVADPRQIAARALQARVRGKAGRKAGAAYMVKTAERSCGCYRVNMKSESFGVCFCGWPKARPPTGKKTPPSDDALLGRNPRAPFYAKCVPHALLQVDHPEDAQRLGAVEQSRVKRLGSKEVSEQHGAGASSLSLSLSLSLSRTHARARLLARSLSLSRARDTHTHTHTRAHTHTNTPKNVETKHTHKHKDQKT